MKNNPRASFQLDDDTETKPIQLRVPIDDLERARQLAAMKGIRYQTYLKSLIHEALGKSVLPKITRHIVALSEQLLSKIKSIPVTGDPNRYFKAILIFFTLRGTQTMKALELLVEAGYTDQALVLARTMVEMGINTVYINQEPEKRGELYLEYDFVLRMKMLNKARRHNSPVLTMGLPEQIRELEEEYDRIKANYPKKDSWSGKGVADMAEACGPQTKWYYDFIYALLCQSSHNAVRKMNEYFEDDPSGAIRMKGGTDMRHYDQALLVAATNFLIIISHLDEQFNLGHAKQIESYLDEINSAVGNK